MQSKPMIDSSRERRTDSSKLTSVGRKTEIFRTKKTPILGIAVLDFSSYVAIVNRLTNPLHSSTEAATQAAT